MTTLQFSEDGFCPSLWNLPNLFWNLCVFFLELQTTPNSLAVSRPNRTLLMSLRWFTEEWWKGKWWSKVPWTLSVCPSMSLSTRTYDGSDMPRRRLTPKYDSFVSQRICCYVEPRLLKAVTNPQTQSHTCTVYIYTCICTWCKVVGVGACLKDIWGCHRHNIQAQTEEACHTALIPAQFNRCGTGVCDSHGLFW